MEIRGEDLWIIASSLNCLVHDKRDRELCLYRSANYQAVQNELLAFFLIIEMSGLINHLFIIASHNCNTSCTGMRDMHGKAISLAWVWVHCQLQPKQSIR